MNTLQSGFLIVKTFETVYHEYIRTTPLEHALYSIPYRGADIGQMPHRYRGGYRGALSAVSLEDLTSWLREDRSIVEPPVRAATLAIDVLQQQDKSEDDFIVSLADARDVYTLLERPTEWEVVWKSRTEQNAEPPPYTELLGFEPAFFLRDHFSAVCDCMCFPRWHGTDTEGSLFAHYHSMLNENALFDTPEEASQFLDFYLSHDWTETGPYSTVEIRALRVDLCEYLLSKPKYAFLSTGARTRHEYPQDADDVPRVPGLSWDVTLQALTLHQIHGCLSLFKLTRLRDLGRLKAVTENLPLVLRILYIGEKERLVDRLTTAGFEFEIEPYF